MLGKAENRKDRAASLGLSAPRLTALREELSTLQEALRSIQPRVDPAALRLVRQFHAQLATSTAHLTLSGTPGAGVSSLTRMLSGDQGGAPQRDNHSTQVDAVVESVLPVRLIETAAAPALESMRGLSNRLSENNLALIVLRADLLIGSIDFSLVRLLREPHQNPIILFVNRIDLLDEPGEDMAAIRSRLEEMIQRHRPNSSVKIVFGSLSWAEAAQTGLLAGLSDDSKESLLALAEVAEVDGDDHAPSFVWKLSGLPELVDAIGLALEESPLRRVLGKIRRHLQSALADLDVENRGMASSLDPSLAVQLSVAEATHRAAALSQRLIAEMDRQISHIEGQVRSRIERVGCDYAQSALAEMQHVLEDRTDSAMQWDVDPFRVRLQLRSACLGFAQSCRALTDRMLRRAAREYATLSRDLLGSETGLAAPETALGTFLSVRAPELHKPAIGMGDGPWSWRPRSGQTRPARLREFKSHLNVKIASLLREAEDRQIAAPTKAMRQRLEEFLVQQAEALIALAATGAGAQNDSFLPVAMRRDWRKGESTASGNNSTADQGTTLALSMPQSKDV
jgi:hypothetical protein